MASDEHTPLLLADAGNKNTHDQFCLMAGVPPSDRPAGKSGVHVPPKSLYGRATRQYRKARMSYNCIATLSNTLLLSQVILGAALTALGASESSHILITVFGALNTIIAGLVAYLKSRGQPARARMFRDDLERVVDEIENSEIMWMGIADNVHGYDEIDVDDKVTVRSELARLMRLYERAVANNMINNPDNYLLATGRDGAGTALRSRPSPAAAAPAPVAAAPAPIVTAAVVAGPSAAAPAAAPSPPLAAAALAASAADPDASPATAPPKPAGADDGHKKADADDKSKDSKDDDKPKDSKDDDKPKDSKADDKPKDSKADDKPKDSKADDKPKDSKADDKADDKAEPSKPKDSKAESKAEPDAEAAKEAPAAKPAETAVPPPAPAPAPTPTPVIAAPAPQEPAPADGQPIAGTITPANSDSPDASPALTDPVHTGDRHKQKATSPS